MTRRTSGGKAYPLFRPSVHNLMLALGVASGTVLSAGAAYLLGAIVDGLASGGLTLGEIVARLTTFLGVSLAAALAKFALDDWLPLKANLRAEVEASDGAIDQLLAMPQRAFERHDAGHFLNVVNAAAFGYGAMAVYLNVNAVGYAIAVVALLGCATAIDVLLVLVFLCGLAVYFAVNWGPMHSAGRLLMEMMPASEAWQEEVRRLVEEKRAANAGAAEEFYLQRFEGSTNEYRAFLRRHRLADTVQATLPAAISPALQVAVLAVCVALWSAGQVSLGSVVAAWQLFSLLQTPMAGICSFVSFYVASRPNVVLLREHAGEAGEPSGFEALSTGEKDLVARVEGTLWATPARGEDGKRLWAGEFEVRPGELVVVKGANGTGKSRLLDLVRGLSDLADLDGEAVLAPEALDAAYLTYPVPVVTGSLAENLLGREADPEAARVLDLGDLTERAITDQPLNLSLGERQKLGLLRALSRPEPVVLLDEPLANLDAGVRARLCDHLAGLRGRKTVVAIMHSGELDAAADRIYEVRDGRLSRVC
ncbi:ATP-binding cassette domain-containing protein [Thermophilibacter provencensis]|uniref:ABC transporter ATP-binding protein n=1 Tax=Thermophilibacter provencensis TaxID=1852386 RepID=A0ABT7V1E8_9ACTN|nr:ABC transporter ATP-binding protein [Thermophilibacter provencensis]MDM8270418.1 ABC transporter ATP-binding protein [Thermophilibacter provencensis]